jgi:hypothetical protein
VVTPQGNLIAIGSNYDGTIAPGLTGESGCQVRLRLFGRYLAVDDNGGCGRLVVSRMWWNFSVGGLRAW